MKFQVRISLKELIKEQSQLDILIDWAVCIDPIKAISLCANARVRVFENQMSLSLKKCLKLEHQLRVALSLSKHTVGGQTLVVTGETLARTPLVCSH